MLARIIGSREATPLATLAWQPPESAADRVVERVLAFVLEHRAQSLPQERVARVAGVSPAGFSRWFRSRVGRTWRAFLTEVRVADACRLLADSDRPVTDIALSCGFANLSNFNRRFRQVQRTSPRAYRRAARGRDPELR
ncbi:MAG: helix-turn-helix transcriptional regulator [Planctomycetes bacterium]|nr:helix-turn-helix transcriptional regulator [Planctomycetota bacterium]